MKTRILILLLLASAGAMAQSPADTTHRNIRVKKMRDTLLLSAPQLKIFPNPVKNRAELLVKNFNAGEALVQIVNSSGKTVYSAKRLIASGTDDIVLMLNLPPGVYYCTVIQNGKRARVTLLISS